MNSNIPAPKNPTQDDQDDAAWDALLADPENVQAQDALAREAAELARSGALGCARPMDDMESDTH